MVSGLGPYLCWYLLKQLPSTINTHRWLLTQPSYLTHTKTPSWLACFHATSILLLGWLCSSLALLSFEYSVYLSKAFSIQVQRSTIFPCHLPRHCPGTKTQVPSKTISTSQDLSGVFPNPTPGLTVEGRAYVCLPQDPIVSAHSPVFLWLPSAWSGRY